MAGGWSSYSPQAFAFLDVVGQRTARATTDRKFRTRLVDPEFQNSHTRIYEWITDELDCWRHVKS